MWLTVQKAFGPKNERWRLYFRDVHGYSVRARYAGCGARLTGFTTRKEAESWCDMSGNKAARMHMTSNESFMAGVTQTEGKARCA